MMEVSRSVSGLVGPPCAGETLIQWLLFPACESIGKQLPEVGFAFKNLDSARLVDGLQRGELDLALIRKEEVTPSLMNSGNWRYAHAAFVPKAIARGMDELAAADLARLPWALLEGQGHFRRFLEDVARKEGVRVNCAVECSSFTQVAMAVQTGRYAGFLPEFAAKAVCGSRGEIRQPPCSKGLRYERSLTLAWRDATLRARPVIEQLIPALKAAVSKHLEF